MGRVEALPVANFTLAGLRRAARRLLGREEGGSRLLVALGDESSRLIIHPAQQRHISFYFCPDPLRRQAPRPPQSLVSLSKMMKEESASVGLYMLTDNNYFSFEKT